MQAANYGSKPSVSADEEEPQIEPTKVDTPEAAELKAEQPKAKELIVDISGGLKTSEE